MSLRLAVIVLTLVVVSAGSVRADSSDLLRYFDRGHDLSNAGKPEQALPYFLLALELGEKQFPDGNAGLVPLLESVAEVYTKQGSYRDAEPLFERSLAIQERVLAHDQMGIARTLSALGFIYEATGRREEASKLYNRVLAVWQPSFGPDDPSVVAARDGLAKLTHATPAKAPPAAPSETRYRIHLTSIRNAHGGKREWTRLRQMYPDLLSDIGLAVARVDLGASRGVFHRIQGGPLSQGEAIDRCMTFARRGVWCRVVAASADDRPEAPVAAAAAGKTVSLAPPAGAGFRVHLTSIRNSGRAEEEWSRLRRLYPSLLGDLVLAVERADLGPERGVYYRIEGGPLTKAAALKLCGTFSARQVWCGIVRPIDGTAGWPHGQLVRRVRRRGPQFVAGTWRPEALRRRQRIDRSSRGARPEPGARRFAKSRRAYT